MIQPLMIEGLDQDRDQQRFVALDCNDAAIAVVGPPGSGKTHCLLAHMQRQRIRGQHVPLLLTTGSPLPLAQSLTQFDPGMRDLEPLLSTVQEFAQHLLEQSFASCGFTKPVTILTQREALHRFFQLARSLLDLQWPEFASGEIDPEVSGLRSPERFLATTFRLFERLRSAEIDPESLEERALQGTNIFYAAPPNFANAELIRATKESYRDSLRVNVHVLAHQRRRETDLARIIGRLAQIQSEDSRQHATVSPQQALCSLIGGLQQNPEVSANIRAQFPYVAIDEAQDLSLAQRTLLRIIYGEKYAGLALAGDLTASRTANTGPSTPTFAMASSTVTLHQRYRGRPAIWKTHHTILQRLPGYQEHPHPHPLPPETGTSVHFLRAADRNAEAQAIAAAFATRIAKGRAPERCALILRSLTCAWTFVTPLLLAGIPVDFAGPIDPLLEPRTGDLHGLLWALVDRRKTAAFLRILCSPLLALNDRSIALLCTPPGEPTLFPLEPTARRRTPPHPEQIAANLLDGLTDTTCDESTRLRLETFRRHWERWQGYLTESCSQETISRIIQESGLLVGKDPHARLARAMSSRFLSALDLQLVSSQSQLAEQLRTYDTLSKLDLDPHSCGPIDREALVIASVEAIRGYAFDTVAIAEVRAGAFPRYYVPDSFLFSPSRGFIPRENVGIAGAGRTAKCTWYLHAIRARDAYNHEERRLLASAIARTNRELLISASGSPTRGTTAPEFLEEIRHAHQRFAPS